MELNLVPFIEAVKGITWQGAAVAITFAIAWVLLGWMRLIHAERERQWWSKATPEQIQARAATTATLPPPTRAPTSPNVPLVIMLLLAGCLLAPSDASSIALGVERRRAASCYQCNMSPKPLGDFVHDGRPQTYVTLSLASQ